MTKDDLKGYVNKGMAVSKDALNKAGKAVSKFGDESILKIEIQQYKSQIKKDKNQLGQLAFTTFVENGGESLSANDEAVVKLVESIKKAQKEVKTREEKLESGKLKTEN